MTAKARGPLSPRQRTLDVPLKALRIAPKHAPARSPDQKLIERVRREFSDLRGLSPTQDQAQRLFHVPDQECSDILAQLLQEGFLVRGADGRYRLKLR